MGAQGYGKGLEPALGRAPPLGSAAVSPQNGHVAHRTPAMAAAKLDPKALELLRMLDRDQPGSFSEFVRMFVHEAPDLVRKMENALVAGDIDTLGKSAHYLRSAALAMGASQLVDVCHGLEQLKADEMQDPSLGPRFDQLRRATRDSLLLLLNEVPQI